MRLAVLGRKLPAEDQIRLRQAVFAVIAADHVADGMGDDGDLAATGLVPLQNFAHPRIRLRHPRRDPVLPELIFPLQLLVGKAQLVFEERSDAGVEIFPEIVVQRIRKAGAHLRQIGQKGRKMDDSRAVDDGVVVVEHQTGKPHNAPPDVRYGQA